MPVLAEMLARPHARHEIRTHFEVLKRDAEIAMLRGVLAGGKSTELRAAFEAECAVLDGEFACIGACNLGGECMEPDRIDRLEKIGERTWTRALSNRIGISYAEHKRRDAIPERPLPVTEKLLQDRYDPIVPREGPPLSAPGNPWGFNLQRP